MLSLEDVIERWEDSEDEPVDLDVIENEMWLRADDEAEERWFQRIREEGL